MCKQKLNSKHQDFVISLVNHSLVYSVINIPIVLYCIDYGLDGGIFVLIAILFLLIFTASLLGLVVIGPCYRSKIFVIVFFILQLILFIVTIIFQLLFGGQYVECWGFWVSAVFGTASVIYMLTKTISLVKDINNEEEEELMIDNDRIFEDTISIKNTRVALISLLSLQFVVIFFTGVGYYFVLGPIVANSFGIDPPSIGYPMGFAGTFYLNMLVMGLLFIHTNFSHYFWLFMILESITTTIVVIATGWLVTVTWSIIPFLFLCAIFWAAIMIVIGILIKKDILATKTRPQLMEQNAHEMQPR